MVGERDAFLKETDGAALRVLEALLEESSSQNVAPEALFGAERLAESANARSESKNVAPLTAPEVRLALAPYVRDGIVGVRSLYEGKKPRNGDHQGPAYVFLLLDKERAKEKLPKRDY